MDFNQTFAAIVKQIVFYVLFAIIVYYDFDIYLMNIKKVFLYDYINYLTYYEIQKYIETEAT